MITLPLSKKLFFLQSETTVTRTRCVKLFWEGVWEIDENKIPSNISDMEGIFVILSAKKNPNNKAFDPESYSVLHIGESKNIFGNLRKNKQWNLWKEHSEGGKLLLKIAKTEKGMDRKIIKNTLIFHTHPVCSKGLILPPQKNNYLEIQNLGYKNPLSKTYLLFS